MAHSIDLRSLLAARFQGRPVTIIPYHSTQSLRLPFFETRVPAGFPSPAEDYLDRGLDLNELIVKHPAATFFVRVEGESMIGAGIHPGDTLVVDRAEQPTHGRIVVAAIDGDFTVKRISKIDGKLLLVSENPDLPPLHIAPEAGFEVWGVVTYVIHRIR